MAPTPNASTLPRLAQLQQQVLPGWLTARQNEAARADWQTRGEVGEERRKEQGQEQAPVLVLALSGRWQRGPLPRRVAWRGTTALVVDGTGLLDWDARLAGWLWPLVEAAQRRGLAVVLKALPPALQASLDVALEQLSQQPAPVPGPAGPPAGPAWLRRIGSATARQVALRTTTLAFIGQVGIATVAALGCSVRPGRRSPLRLADVALQFEQVGPRSLGIVALVSALVGLILAYMSGAQLQLFGAQAFVAPLLSVGEVREIAALVVGIVLAGRVAASFAAQLATMRSSEEIDALRTLGVDPIGFLVLPRLAALLLAAPLLTVMAAACGVAAGGLVAMGVYDVPAREFLARGLEPLSYTHLGVGLFKGLLYGALVGLAGCRQGLHAEPSAQGVGQATTAAVVQAIVWVASAAAATTVIFHQLGW